MKDRVRVLRDGPPRANAEYVLYWSQMNRRATTNHALAYAAEKANELSLPLLVYEGLTCSYPFACDRYHAFILNGVPEMQKRIRKLGAGYVFNLRRKHSDPDDALYRLAEKAAMVVADDYPTFVAARYNASVPRKIAVPYHVVDGSCVAPMNCFHKREWAAYSIRPKIHRLLPEHLKPLPPIRLRRKYTGAPQKFHTEVTANGVQELIAECEIDHSVAPSISYAGGQLAAERQLKKFLATRLSRYAKERNTPSNHATSDLSPWLHFGQIGSLEVALAVSEYAAEHKLIAHEFLEELIVRRELAFNFTRFCENPETLDALPDWAKATLAKHDGDARPATYTAAEFEFAKTYDALWNACQKELLLRGKIHGYYRMYWGKKIIEWSPSHAEALRTMLFLHDKYALDGRDPNTYTNILWCFGLHDRPWTERPIFGMVRYMGLDGMKRKTDVNAYLKEIAYLEDTGKDPWS